MSAITTIKQKASLVGALILSLLLITFALGGCVANEDGQIVIRETGSSDNLDTVILTFYGYKADSLNLVAIENTIAGFNKDNPDINVVYEGAKGTTYWEALDLRAQTDNLNDLFMTNSDYIKTMSAEGKLANLSDIDVVGEYNDFVLSQITEPNGDIYFIPMNISSYNLYINYDILDKHNQPIPTNWSEFVQVCDFFAKQGITPIIANNYNSLSSLAVAYAMYPIYQQENSSEIIQSFGDDPQKYIDTIRPGIERVSEMVERGWFDPEEVLATAQTSDDLDIFAQNERPFMVTGGWASPRVVSKNADLNFGIHPYPIMDDGCILSVDVNTCVSAKANGENLNEAKKFVQYLTDPDALWEYCESQSSYSPLKDDREPSDQHLKPSLEYLDNGRNVIGTDYQMPLAVDSALYENVTKLLEGYSVDEVCALILADISQSAS